MAQTYGAMRCRRGRPSTVAVSPARPRRASRSPGSMRPAARRIRAATDGSGRRLGSATCRSIRSACIAWREGTLPRQPFATISSRTAEIRLSSGTFKTTLKVCAKPATIGKRPNSMADSEMRKRSTSKETSWGVCPTCGKDFIQPLGTGRARKHCSDECRLRHHRVCADRRRAARPRCCVEGCEGRATRVRTGMCEKHYTRIVRRGVEPERAAFKYRYFKAEGYALLLEPGHPLADAGGRVYEHRAVLYAKYGHGTQGCPGCYWCGQLLTWKTLVVDHLNEEKMDNRPENLVPACNRCNRARGAFLTMTKRVRLDRLDEMFSLFRQHALRKGEA